MSELVFFVDFSHQRSDRKVPSNNLMPLAIGLIASFTKKAFGDAVTCDVFKFNGDLMRNVPRRPRLIGFSTYVWNSNLSYAVAERLKRQDPSVVIVFGGPHYPLEAEAKRKFLCQRPAIDFYIEKEGELAFTQLLEALMRNGFDAKRIKNDPGALGNLNFLYRDELVATPLLKRIPSIEEIPSPYTTGLFDKFFDAGLGSLMQTNRGCPFHCTFCQEGVDFYSKVVHNSQQKLYAELEYIAQRDKKNGHLRLTDANFGMFDSDRDFARAVMEVRAKYGWPKSIFGTPGKNRKEHVMETIDILEGLMVYGASVQSLDKEVLRYIKRSNINENKIIEIAQTGAMRGIQSYTEIILGLPGDTLQKYLTSIEKVMNAGIDAIRIYHLKLYPGAEMSTMADRARFGFETKWRPLANSFGDYEICGERVWCAEAEEVFWSSATFQTAELDEALDFVLSNELFYNDGLFKELLEYVRILGRKNFELVKFLHHRLRLPSSRIGHLYRDYKDEVKAELWGSFEELMAYASTREAIRHFSDLMLDVDAKLKYKAKAFDYFEDLRAGVLEAMEEFLAMHIPDSLAVHLDAIENILRFIHCRRASLYSDHAKVFEDRFDYDIAAPEFWERLRATRVPPRAEEPITYRFAPHSSGRELLERFLDIHGEDSPELVVAKLSAAKIERACERITPLMTGSAA
jgi:radical SAM superfamily enzyme YgiQ (UPF0313 family)